MHFVRFTTEIPLDHLARGLDELRRIGFGLCAVSVTAPDGLDYINAAPVAARADIRIDYRPKGALSPQVFLDRIARMPGVHDLQGGLAHRAKA